MIFIIFFKPNAFSSSQIKFNLPPQCIRITLILILKNTIKNKKNEYIEFKIRTNTYEANCGFESFSHKKTKYELNISAKNPIYKVVINSYEKQEFE
jgi:hypothetical protein